MTERGHWATKIGVDEGFLDEVGKALTPGKFAVVAEAWEREAAAGVGAH
jgi:hypothetical protein